ncbi:GAF domain-containing protein [Amycolatopsis oliviviridis]|uniref:GAF domain-containing protein n=1 Tax=Amycolatopsis oliviviridis TaxID=1471590 RepID=A0ABQ3LY18_9PSEU|nr:GAF and ANTAR domain-containing protein [Amycolatopsis oliviviridis]GHH28634.1 GAF domain-containing protein [Amycolatopsis oliviviridis]
MTTPPGATGPSHDPFAALLTDLRRAADTGRDLSAASPATAATLLELDGLTLCVVTAEGHLELLWSDPARRRLDDLDDLQYILGEGPSADAARLGEAVIVTDLTSVPADRWPAFQPAALRTPIRAIIAIPLIFGAGPLGVLTGYRSTPGPFAPGTEHELGRLAVVMLQLLLQTPMGPLATDDGKHLALHRAEIHQATGILTVQLGIQPGPALALLRAYAYRHDRPLLSVARDIIAHRIRLSPP